MKKKQSSRKPADAMDWDEATRLVRNLTEDGRYRDSMLIASGCYLGLRISDTLTLKWGDICCSEKKFLKTETKTGKTRSLGLNKKFVEHARMCREELGNPDDDTYVFPSWRGGYEVPLTRYWAWKIMKEMQETYKIRSAKQFSTHSLRKTFGRRVWLQECSRGRGDQALVLLQEIFGHSSIAITKRYLGIREDEILSVYESLD